MDCGTCHIAYAGTVAAKLREQGVRVEVDARGERMNAKIRDAQLRKVPYMLVVGDKEAEQGNVAMRLRNGDNPGPTPLPDFLTRVRQEIAGKASW